MVDVGSNLRQPCSILVLMQVVANTIFAILIVFSMCNRQSVLSALLIQGIASIQDGNDDQYIYMRETQILIKYK